MKGKHSVTIRILPKDARDEILDFQAYLQKKCGCVMSKEKTVISIIRHWKRVKNYNVKNGITVLNISDELANSQIDRKL